MRFNIEIPKIKYQALFLAAYLFLVPNAHTINDYFKPSVVKDVQYTPLYPAPLDVNEPVDVNDLLRDKRNELESLLERLKTADEKK